MEHVRGSGTISFRHSSPALPNHCRINVEDTRKLLCAGQSLRRACSRTVAPLPLHLCTFRCPFRERGIRRATGGGQRFGGQRPDVPRAGVSVVMACAAASERMSSPRTARRVTQTHRPAAARAASVDPTGRTARVEKSARPRSRVGAREPPDLRCRVCRRRVAAHRVGRGFGTTYVVRWYSNTLLTAVWPRWTTWICSRIRHRVDGMPRTNSRAACFGSPWIARARDLPYTAAFPNRTPL